ncbi:3'(2'),5'-bisphosphate nucleotidase CysQ [Candidatus Woesearchaeota archaeon]|nr:3'(2'),5'-bisphosphate nucleotidase CysQ [Candidatus Woesearchaeota archaeon]
MNLSPIQEDVLEIISEAGALLLTNFDQEHAITKKSDNTPVTDIDHLVSAYLSKNLREKYPSFGLIDEEQNSNPAERNKEFCWVIDPLDSTRDYIERKDGFGIIIGLLQESKPVLGVTYKPAKKEIASTLYGEGAFLYTDGERKRITVSPSSEINLILSRSRKSTALDKILGLMKPSSITYMGGATKIVEVAKGEATCYLCPPSSPLHLWDLCGTSLILQEAGGTITDWYGKPFNFQTMDFENRRGVVATNGIIHEQIMKVLRDL